MSASCELRAAALGPAAPQLSVASRQPRRWYRGWGSFTAKIEDSVKRGVVIVSYVHELGMNSNIDIDTQTLFF